MAIPMYHLIMSNLQDGDRKPHHFYRTLTALYLDKGPLLDVSLSTLQKHDFTSTPVYHNWKCEIRIGEMLNTKDVNERKRKMKRSVQKIKPDSY